MLKDKDLWRKLGWNVDRLPDDIYTPMHVINHIFHQGGEHLFAYDFETLKWALNRAGFPTVLRQSFGTSIDSELAIDRENHRPYSLYVDAVKPADIFARPTLRGDVGVYTSSLIPFLRAPAKWIYLRLPRHLHDTPTSWLEARLGKESALRPFRREHSMELLEIP